MDFDFLVIGNVVQNPTDLQAKLKVGEIFKVRDGVIFDKTSALHTIKTDIDMEKFSFDDFTKYLEMLLSDDIYVAKVRDVTLTELPKQDKVHKSDLKNVTILITNSGALFYLEGILYNFFCNEKDKKTYLVQANVTLDDYNDELELITDGRLNKDDLNSYTITEVIHKQELIWKRYTFNIVNSFSEKTETVESCDNQPTDNN